jgi:AraC-like DNA-binding protein
MLWVGDIYISDGLMVYRGRAGDNSRHAHATLQLTLSTREPVILEEGFGGLHKGRALFVRPGVKHGLAVSEDITLVLLEPQTPIARYILAKCSADQIGPVPSDIAHILGQSQPLEHLVKTLRSLNPIDQVDIDLRLERALQFLNTAPLKNAIKNAALDCGLSAPRLRAIAHQQLGIPLSKWILWRAISRASAAIVDGDDLAGAAITGGFADQAHYTRTLRNLIGLTPGQARAPLQ